MNILSRRLIVLTAAGTLCLAFATRAAEPTPDEASVRRVLMAQFDKPEARLHVEPIVVAGDHAVADWAQGERGGRALLQRSHGHWQITACGGDGLKNVHVLAEAGVPRALAEALARSLGDVEARLPDSLLAKFSSFDGLVRMDATGQQPTRHPH